MKVFISTSSFGQFDKSPVDMLEKAGIEISLNPFGRKLTEDEIKDNLQGVDLLIAGTEPLTRSVIDSSGDLKIISRCGTGMDNVDIKAAEDKGIKVYNTPDSPTIAVAELTVGLIFSLRRKINTMDREVRNGVWKKRMGSLMRDKNIGIIGMGRIGCKVAHFVSGFGVNVGYHDINDLKTSSTYKSFTLEDLLAWSDVVSLHLSSGKPGEALIGKDQISKMKSGSVLVNTSRGGLVDEPALYEALNDGNIAGAALDVFDCEPYEGLLSELENIILTPHVGSYAAESRIDMEVQSVKNLLDNI